MALSAFDDKTNPPTESELAAVLGDTSSFWRELKTQIGSRFEPTAEDWTFSGKKWGWALRLKHKKRAVLYMTPCKDHFLVGFALGEKAVAAAHQAGLPQAILDIIDDAPRYAEGRGVRVEVRCAEDVQHVVKLAEVKMAN